MRPGSSAASAGVTGETNELNRRQLLAMLAGGVALVACSSKDAAAPAAASSSAPSGTTPPVQPSVPPPTTAPTPTTAAQPTAPSTTTAPAVSAAPIRPSVNPYLAGNFAPVTDETEAFDLRVRGAIPPELDGILFRNGPNPINPNPTGHWFIGDGMVHAIELSGGRARSYRNRWMRTAEAAPALGEQVPTGAPPLGAPSPTLANTSIVEHAGNLLALMEVALPTRFSRSLDTLGLFDFDGALRAPMTAHPKVDPVTGELWIVSNDFFVAPYLRVFAFDVAGARVAAFDTPLPGPAMVHDFAITETRVVLLDLPVVYDLTLGRPFPSAWKPDYGARVGLVPRTGGDVVWIELDEPCYVFHIANAYDDGERVVLDVCRYSTMFDADILGVADSSPTFERWTVDSVAGRIARQEIDARGQEFPRIDPRVVGRPYRHTYTAEFAPVDGPLHGVGLGALLHHDLSSGVADRLDIGPGRAAGEPVFVPASASSGENEGWVLSVVYDATRDGSDLVIADATDFAAGPVATIELPRRVPFGFHGIWSPTPA